MTLLDAQKLVRDVDGQVAPLAGGARRRSRRPAVPWGKRRSPW